MDKEQWFRQYMLDTASNLKETADQCASSVASATSVIASVFSQGHRLLLVGNGTDASICEIISSRFTSRFAFMAPRQGWPAQNLATSTNFITGHSNRFGIDEIYSRLVQALGAKNDALLAIESGEGAENIAWAMRKAQSMGIHTISLTGFTSKLTKLADVAIKVPFKDSTRISEAHMAIQHAICLLVEGELLK